VRQAEATRQAAVAKAQNEEEDKVRLLGVVVVHLFTCFEEAVGSRGFVSLVVGL